VPMRVTAPGGSGSPIRSNRAGGSATPAEADQRMANRAKTEKRGATMMQGYLPRDERGFLARSIPGNHRHIQLSRSSGVGTGDEGQRRPLSFHPRKRTGAAAPLWREKLTAPPPNGLLADHSRRFRDQARHFHFFGGAGASTPGGRIAFTSAVAL